MDDVGGGILAVVDALGGVFLLLYGGWIIVRTDVVELHTDLILKLVQFGNASLQLRSHAIKIIYNLPQGISICLGRIVQHKTSVKLKQDLPLRLVLDGFSSGLDELLQGEGFSHWLPEDAVIIDDFLLNLVDLGCSEGLEVGVEPKASNEFVFEVEFSQVDGPKVLLGQPSIVHHDGVSGKDVEDTSSIVTTHTVQKHCIITLHLLFHPFQILHTEQSTIANTLELLIVLAGSTHTNDDLVAVLLGEVLHDHFVDI